MAGMRPIVEIMTVNFSLLALDQIVNNAATIPHMSGGQFAVPLVIRMATGAGRQLAAQHSHSLEGWYAHIPGLKVLAPATIEDARFMLQPALDDPDPVLIFEHVMLYNREDELDPTITGVDITLGEDPPAGERRHADHLRRHAVQDAGSGRDAAPEGIEAEVIDLRVLRPLDMPTMLGSVARTRRVVIIDEGWKSGSLSAEIARTHRRGVRSTISTRRSAASAARSADTLRRASRAGRVAAGAGHRCRGAGAGEGG